jgi:hypothetical protein
MARCRDVVGIATVAITADGQYHLVIAGESYDKPHTTLAGTLRLEKAAHSLLPDLVSSEDTEV